MFALSWVGRGTKTPSRTFSCSSASRGGELAPQRWLQRADLWLCFSPDYEVGLTKLDRCRQQLQVEMFPFANRAWAGGQVGKDLLGHIYCMEINQRLHLSFLLGKSGSKAVAGPTSPECPSWAVWSGLWALGLCPSPKASPRPELLEASSQASPPKGVPSPGTKRMEAESPTLGMLLCFRYFGLLSPAQR